MTDFVQIERITNREFRRRFASPGIDSWPGLFEPQLPRSLLSPYLAERLVTSRSEAIPECVRCGACCLIPLIVPVSASEAKKLTTYTEIVYDEVDDAIVVGRVINRSETGECINLKGTIGVEVGCAVYQDRPQCCRDFDPGSDRCHEFRRMYGLEPQLTDPEVERAMTLLSVRVVPNVIKDVSIVKVGTKVSIAIPTGEEPVQSSESLRLKIFVKLEDESEHELHEYDPAREEWLETDLLGLSLVEAHEQVRERILQEEVVYV